MLIVSVKEIKNFLISIIIPLIVGFLSSTISKLLLKMDISEFYSQLIKPSFAPPSNIFPVVWTILFILMGISYYIISKNDKKDPKVNDALFYYYLQLGLNFLWSILFFGLDLRFTAIFNILILIVVVLVMIFKFYKIDKRAAFLNIPYLLWLIVALFLNYFIWIINK